MGLIAYSILLWSGIQTTLKSYNPSLLLAYIPILGMWGFFWGIPPIIGSIRIKEVFTKKELARVLLAQFALIGILFLIVAQLGIFKILPTVLLTGVVTGATMPAESLRKERGEIKSSNRTRN